MARTQAEATTTATETTNVPPEVSAGNSRAVVLQVKQSDGSVKSVKRTDYIRDRWTNGRASRSQIAAELTELQGAKVPYQVVFQATKGIDGGPIKTEAATSAEATEASAE